MLQCESTTLPALISLIDYITQIHFVEALALHFCMQNIKQMLYEKSNAHLFITYWPKSALGDYKRFDFVEELLSHNLVHVVEMIFEYVGFPYTWSCIQVNHLWHDFLSHHFFPRWADQMMNHDMSLCEIYEPEEIESMSAGKIFLQYILT